MKILYKLASRSRPDKMFSVIENILSMSFTNNYMILVSMDIDDPSVANNEVNTRLKSYGSKVFPVYGFSESKIYAINRDICFFNSWDVLVNISDDQAFTVFNFDVEIKKAFHNFDGLVHFLDKNNPAVCTLSMISRDYYDEDGFVYHPRFKSVYADNFQQELAKKRGAYKFVNKEIFIHNHYRWGLSKEDDLYKKNESNDMYLYDRKVRDELRKQYGLCS